MKRRKISETERARIFTAAGGICHICGSRIDAGRERWDVEHIVPLAQGGEDGGDNLRPAHVPCHLRKSAQDAANTARAQRLERRALGIKRTTKGRGFPTGKDKPWKSKVGGGTVRREGRG